MRQETFFNVKTIISLKSIEPIFLNATYSRCMTIIILREFKNGIQVLLKHKPDKVPLKNTLPQTLKFYVVTFTKRPKTHTTQ